MLFHLFHNFSVVRTNKIGKRTQGKFLVQRKKTKSKMKWPLHWYNTTVRSGEGQGNKISPDKELHKTLHKTKWF